MLHSLERTFKRVVSFLLRIILGSRPVVISPEATFARILVIRQHNQLGDMLCAVPLLRALRERFPSAHIALLASPVNYDVMLHLRYLDNVIKFDKQDFLCKGLHGVGNLLRFIRMLRSERFDLAIVPSSVSVSFTSDLLSLLSGARIRIGARSLNGKGNTSAFCFNVPVELDWRETPNRHQTLRNLDIGRPLNLFTNNLSHEITLNDLEVKESNRLKHEKLLPGKRIVVYHPGAGKSLNRWSAASFAAVATQLAREFSVRTLITAGGMDDAPVAEMTARLLIPYELVSGKTIREVAVILSAADLVISNDTGIMHVAAAVGVPVLSLFGPTEPEQWAPIGAQNHFLRGERGDVNTISVEEVLRCAKDMLSKHGDG